MVSMMEHKNDKLTKNWGYWGSNHWGVNLLIDTSSGAAFKASCGRCGNREIATPMIATPMISNPERSTACLNS